MENIPYDQAAKELEEILESLKNNEVSIDELESKVDRAAKLAKLCALKLKTTEEKIQGIIDKLGL